MSILSDEAQETFDGIRKSALPVLFNVSAAAFAAGAGYSCAQGNNKGAIALGLLSAFVVSVNSLIQVTQGNRLEKMREQIAEKGPKKPPSPGPLFVVK